MAATDGFKHSRMTARVTPRRSMEFDVTETRLQEMEIKQLMASQRYYESLQDKAEASKMSSVQIDHTQAA